MASTEWEWIGWDDELCEVLEAMLPADTIGRELDKLHSDLVLFGEAYLTTTHRWGQA